MRIYQPAKSLSIHLTEPDRYQGEPLYAAIVEKCREMKIARATVFRGLEGYGGAGEIHRQHLLTRDLPVVVQIVDSDANIQRLLPVLEDMIDEALIDISDVSTLRICSAASDGLQV